MGAAGSARADPLAPDAVRAAYDRRARWYDGMVLFLAAGLDGVYRRSAVAALGPPAGARVLDVGAGTGLNLPLVRSRIGAGGLLVACDASRGMLAVAREPARRARAHLVLADGVRLPFRAGAADALLATYVVTTVPDPVAATAEMLRCVRSGGRVALTDDRLPPGWFLGPRALLRGLRQRGWRDSLGPVRAALRRACGRVACRVWHGGLIWLLAGTRR